MIYEGKFNYYLDGQSKTYDEIVNLVTTDMTVSIDGLNVKYSSPKKEIKTDINQQLCDLLGAISQETRRADGITESTKGYDKIQELLKEADEYQKQNGGILKGAEFPFDNIVADWIEELSKDTKESNIFKYNPKEEKVIEDLNRKEFYIIPPSKENLDRMCDSFMDRVKNDSDKCGIVGKKENRTAYKETEGKLFYELDWEFITQMAERMSANKKESKYDLWNWKKPMTPKGIEDLKQATLRHLLAVLDENYQDDGREFGHIEAIADNMMMINYQLKNNQK